MSSWGNDIRFRIEPPTSGGWFCFDLVVSFHEKEMRYQDIKSDFRWYHRLWHWIARPVRRAR